MTPMKTTMIVAGVMLALGVSTVQAQTSAATTTVPMHHRFFGGFGGYSNVYAGTYGDAPATTPLQGFAYGYARMAEAAANADYTEANAAMKISEARVLAMENWKKAIETSFEIQKMNRDLRAAERGRPLGTADYLRLAQIGKPQRLTPSQFNPMTGELAWPIVLDDGPFASYRQALDRLFAERAEHGRLKFQDYARAEEMAHSMTDLLRDRIGDLAPADYMAARRFLESLAYELTLPATGGEEMRTAAFRPVR
jgi:hypothetical protein